MFTTQGGVEIEQVAAENPEALARVHVDPLEGYEPHHARRAARRRSTIAGEQAQIAQIVGEPLPLLRRVRRDALRDQPADRHARGRGARARREGDDRRLGALPPSRARGARATRRRPTRSRRFARERGVTYVKLDGSVGILGNGAGLVDGDGRRGRRRRRPAGELLRPRRRRLGRGRRRGARGDRPRPAGALDPLQHLRRHHPLRRGRARDPDGARRDRRSPSRSSSGSTGRTPTEGAAHPRRRGPRRTLRSSRRCSTPPGARWSSRR